MSLLVVGCTDGSSDVGHGGAAGATTADARDADALPPIVVTTDETELAPGDELVGVCQTFSLGNVDPIFVRAVTFEASPGVHHSDWSSYDEDAVNGPDGSADCMTFEGFGVTTDSSKHAFLFSQSTQSTRETQDFGDGAALRIPPHSKLLVSYHLQNPTADRLKTRLTASLQPARPEEVTTRLVAGGGLIGILAVPPLSRSRFHADCTFDGPPSFKTYFMLPHYHQRGRGMRLELLGGSRDGEVVWQNEGTIGEALGARIAPAVDVTGSTGFRFTCLYDNTTTETLACGASPSQEMCSFFVHTDAPRQFYGVAAPAFGPTSIRDEGTNAAGERVFAVDGCQMLLP